MDDIIDLIATDASASTVTDRIKDTLFAKAAERIEASKPLVSGAVFDSEEPTEQEQEG